MGRISISVADYILEKVDTAANKRGIPRSAWIAEAIESTIMGGNKADEELHKAHLATNKAETEVMKLNQQITKLNNQLQEKGKAIESTSSEVNQLREELKQTSDNLIKAGLEVSKYEMAIKLKDDEISFLRGHVSQLSEKITPALMPSPEEIKEKGSWWKFWK